MSIRIMPRYVCSGERGSPGGSSSRSCVDEGRSGLSRDLLEDGAREDLGPEDGRDVLGPHLVDEAGHVARAGIGEVGGLHGADDVEAVLPRPVRPRIVVRQELARSLGDGRHRLADARVKVVERGGVALEVLGEVLRVRRVGLGESVADALRVLARVRHVHPEMRIGVAFGLREAEVEQPLIRRDGLVAELHDRRIGPLRRLGQIERRLLQVEPVDDDEVRPRQGRRIGRAGLERVRVRRVGDDARGVGSGSRRCCGRSS